MAGFQASEHIDRSPEEVFSFICSFDDAPRWLAGVTRAEKTTEGPLSVGARYLETRVAGEREGQAEMEVTEYDPPRRFAAAFAEGGYEIAYRYTVEAEDSGTRVDMVYSVTGWGLKKLMVPIVAWATGRQDKGRLASLKAVIESEE